MKTDLKTKSIDTIYRTTKDKMGASHTRKALKYILFNDLAVLENSNEITDKYNFITNKNGSREMLKHFELIDIIEVLDIFVRKISLLEKNIDIEDLEFFKKLNILNHNKFYSYLSMNKKEAIRLFDLFIKYRYKNNLDIKLDQTKINDKNLKNEYNEIRKEIWVHKY